MTTNQLLIPYILQNNEESFGSYIDEQRKLFQLFRNELSPELLKIVVVNDNATILEALLDIVAIDQNIQTIATSLLHTAAEHNSMNCMKIIMPHNPDLYCANQYNQIALHIAAIYSYSELYDYMVGLDSNQLYIIDVFNYSPDQYMAFSVQKQLSNQLISQIHTSQSFTNKISQDSDQLRLSLLLQNALNNEQDIESNIQLLINENMILKEEQTNNPRMKKLQDGLYVLGSILSENMDDKKLNSIIQQLQQQSEPDILNIVTKLINFKQNVLKSCEETIQQTLNSCLDKQKEINPVYTQMKRLIQQKQQLSTMYMQYKVLLIIKLQELKVFSKQAALIEKQCHQFQFQLYQYLQLHSQKFQHNALFASSTVNDSSTQKMTVEQMTLHDAMDELDFLDQIEIFEQKQRDCNAAEQPANEENVVINQTDYAEYQQVGYISEILFQQINLVEHLDEPDNQTKYYFMDQRDQQFSNPMQAIASRIQMHQKEMQEYVKQLDQQNSELEMTRHQQSSMQEQMRLLKQENEDLRNKQQQIDDSKQSQYSGSQNAFSRDLFVKQSSFNQIESINHLKPAKLIIQHDNSTSNAFKDIETPNALKIKDFFVNPSKQQQTENRKQLDLDGSAADSSQLQGDQQEEHEISYQHSLSQQLQVSGKTSHYSTKYDGNPSIILIWGYRILIITAILLSLLLGLFVTSYS